MDNKLLTTFTYILRRVVRMSSKTCWVVLIDVANKMQYLILPNDLKHNEASFSTISKDILYLRASQTPRSPDLAIFVRQNYHLRMRAGTAISSKCTIMVVIELCSPRGHSPVTHTSRSLRTSRASSSTWLSPR